MNRQDAKNAKKSRVFLGVLGVLAVGSIEEVFHA
jgi:hypothetical protein